MANKWQISVNWVGVFIAPFEMWGFGWKFVFYIGILGANEWTSIRCILNLKFDLMCKID